MMETSKRVSNVDEGQPDREAVDQPAAGASVLLSGLKRQAALLSAVDLPDHDADEAAISDLCVRLSAELEQFVEGLLALERHLIPQEEASQEVHDEHDFEPETAVTNLRSQPTMLGDVCFIGSLELTHAARALTRAATVDDRLAALESAQRKLRRAWAAVLEAAHHVRALEGDVLVRERSQDLDAGLAVRRAYASFRRSLRRPVDASAEALAMALRYAAFALVSLFATPEFRRARVSDRNLLRHLHRRLLDWAQAQRIAPLGRELLEDIFTAADLLRGVSRRQEVRAHDAALVQELLARHTRRLSFAELEPLLGLDDTLDALLERGRGGADSDWLGEVTARLEVLAVGMR